MIREIAKIEPRLAKVTGYHAKLIEKSGRSLAKLLSPSMSPPRCHRSDCQPCQNPDLKGNSLCNTKNVVYESVCEICDNTVKNGSVKIHLGRYVGQSYRTLFERAEEHVKACKRYDLSYFMFKHWATQHHDLVEPPKLSLGWLEPIKIPSPEWCMRQLGY